MNKDIENTVWINHLMNQYGFSERDWVSINEKINEIINNVL